MKDNSVTLLIPGSNHRVWINRDKDGYNYVLKEWKKDIIIKVGQLSTRLSTHVDNILEASKFKEASKHRAVLSLYFKTFI